MSLEIKRMVVGGLLVLAVGGALAQASGLTRTMVGKADVSIAGKEAVVAKVEVAPGGMAGWHNHPGDEISYVLEGEVTLLMAGQPPRKVVAGESFVVPAGTGTQRDEQQRCTGQTGGCLCGGEGQATGYACG